MELALRDMGLDASMLTAIHEMLDIEFDEEGPPTPAGRPGGRQPSCAFVRDNKAIRATKADILEYPNSYLFIVDMPGVKPEDIKVQVEDGNVLVVSGERRRDKERENKEGVRYVRMERRQGKFFKKFELPDNVNLDSISATYQDGLLTITVEKKQPEQKPAKTIEVKMLGGGGGGQIGGVGSGAGEGREQQQEQAVDESAGGGVQG